jgi:hypothetical protein
MERGRYFGFFLDGEHAGQVQEATSRIYETFRPPPVIAAAYTHESDAGGLLPSFEIIREQWYHQEAVIGGRSYGVWMRTQVPDIEDYSAAILALIDMDPVQARLCETRVRRV